MKVLVYEIEKQTNPGDFSKSKEIICPQCGDENILINIKNYRISLSGCKNGHNTNNLFLGNFINSQKIDTSKIICNKCNKINKSDAYNKEFFRCNKCNMNLCPLCKSIHEKSHNIINYDKKNYICPEHNCFYIKYCNQCKKNICIQCEKNHKNHDNIYLGDILPDKENSINILNELKEYIEKFNIDISNVINKLNQVRENLNTYYNLAYDIINNYEMQSINYHLLKNINEFNNFNNIILKDIKETINSDNIFNKTYKMINIYNKMNNINNKKNDSLYIENYKCDKIINLKGEATSILLLKNKKDIAVCLTNGFIEIYDVLTGKLKLSSRIINNNNLTQNTILDIIEIKENIFCISCWDFIIRMIIFYDDNTKINFLQNLSGHKSYINSLRKLAFYKNDIVIASSSNDGTVILWKYNKENFQFNKFKEIKIFLEESQKYQDFQIESLEESIKYNQLICGQSVIQKVYFCNLNDLSQIKKMSIRVNRCIKALKIIDDDFLIVEGYQEIYITHIKLKVIISSIKYYVNCEFNCIFVKRNGNILITEYGNVCRIKEFKFDKNKLHLNLMSEREKEFSNYITTIAELDNEDLIAGGYDKTIKIFLKN